MLKAILTSHLLPTAAPKSYKFIFASIACENKCNCKMSLLANANSFRHNIDRNKGIIRKIKMNFGVNLKTYRKERNMTQEQLAIRLNISRQSVSNWENGINLPEIEMLISIANVFELSLDQLVLGKGNVVVESKPVQESVEPHGTAIALINCLIGAYFLLSGLGCIWIKSNAVEFIDAVGTLHESFFLIPLGIVYLSIGAIILVPTIIKSLKNNARKKHAKAKGNLEEHIDA